MSSIFKIRIKYFSFIKKVFDPSAILNPDKAIPTLNRCAEFGHMHVINQINFQTYLGFNLDARNLDKFSERIIQANKEKYKIYRGDSKKFFGYDIIGDEFKTSDYSGVVDYDPKELIITANVEQKFLKSSPC